MPRAKLTADVLLAVLPLAAAPAAAEPWPARAMRIMVLFATGGPADIRQLDTDGRYGIFFAAQQIAAIDLTQSKSVSDVSEQLSAMSPD